LRLEREVSPMQVVLAWLMMVNQKTNKLNKYESSN
jgi:hypothetical protein